MQFLNQHALSILIFLPLVTAIGTVLIPRLPVARVLGLASSCLSFFIALHVWVYFDGSLHDLQFVEAYEWIPSFGIRYIVGVDGLSLLLLVLTTFLSPLILISQWHIGDSKQRIFLALFHSLQCGMVGSLVAFDLFFFYIFWEAMLIPMYFIIGVWGGPRRIYATTKFIIYTVVGSLLMLAAAIALYFMHYQQFGTYSTSLLDLYRVSLLKDAQIWLFAAFALAFAIKVPLWPFHTWLPDAHVEAPTSGSVILAGVLLKLGTYGFIRFAIPLFPDAVVTFAPVLMGLAIIGIIYGALTAWVQTDAKKLVAYSSVSHLGFVVVGSLALLSSGALSEEAMTGSVYQMINHGMSTGALFFLVGVVYERRHTRMLSDFGGLAQSMPWFAVFLIVATLGSVGLPGTGGFVGEFLILLGTYQSSPFAAILASLGVLLGAIYMLTLCRRMLFGPLDKDENKKLKDLSPREALYLTPLILLIIAMGVYPEIFIAKTRASINHLTSNFKNYRIFVHIPDEATNSYSQINPVRSRVAQDTTQPDQIIDKKR